MWQNKVYLLNADLNDTFSSPLCTVTWCSAFLATTFRWKTAYCPQRLMYWMWDPRSISTALCGESSNICRIEVYRKLLKPSHNLFLINKLSDQCRPGVFAPTPNAQCSRSRYEIQDIVILIWAIVCTRLKLRSRYVSLSRINNCRHCNI